MNKYEIIDTNYNVLGYISAETAREAFYLGREKFGESVSRARRVESEEGK